MRDKLTSLVAGSIVAGIAVGVTVLYAAGLIGFFAVLTWAVLWVLRSQGVL